MMKKPESVDEYIAVFPKETQKLLKQIRATIKKAAPKAEEKISYAGIFVQRHVGLFCRV